MADTIMVAYSFNQDNPLEVDAELKAIRELVQKTKCKIDPLPLANQQQIEERLMLLNKSILVFHFAGHAGGAAIELNDGFSDTVTFTDMKVFAETIAQDAGALRLVFLNGCSTKDQSEYLRNQGIPAVISTTLPLDDGYALEFARFFYRWFLSKELNLSLQSAFTKALKSFNSSDKTRFFTETGELKNQNLLHPAKRGNFILTQDDPREIYQLEGDAAVLGQTFDEWQSKAAETESKPLDLDKAAPANGGPHFDDAYLLCDRGDQVNLFNRILVDKAAGKLPQPHFIFINGHNSDGVSELLLRLDKYVLPSVCGQFGHRLETLKFPDEAFFDLENDPKKPMLALEEIFQTQVVNKPGQGFGDNSLFVFCHKIYKPFWKEGIEALFRHYIGGYSNTLRQLSPRIVVLFLLVHSGKPEQKPMLTQFGDMYRRLKSDFNSQMEFFEALPLIEEGDLFEWHDEVFQTSWDTTEYPIEESDMFYLDAVRYMKKVITANKSNA